MKKIDFIYLLKIIGLILLFSILFDRIVFFTLNTISDRVYTGQGIGKLNHYLEIKDTTDIIIYGSSRANRHFVSKEIGESCYNVGIDGRKVAYPATLVQLLPQHKKQTVVFHLDISYAIDENYHGEDVDALLTKYNRIPEIKKNIDKLHQNNALQNVYKSIGYNGFVISTLYNYLKPKYDKNNYDGYDPNFINPNQQENLKKLIQNRTTENCGKSIKINQVTQNSLEEISRFCKENNKNLIIVTSPVYEDKCQNDNEYLKNFMKSKNYNYLDYSNFFEGKNKIEYWKDFSHMSDQGAKLFSEKFSKDMNLFFR